MFDILSNICKRKQNVSIYLNSEKTTKFVYGKILVVNSDEIAIYMYSLDGEFDGIMLKSIDDVIRIEVEGQYDEKMKKLISCTAQEVFQYTFDFPNLKQSLLFIASQTKQVVSIEVLDSGFDDVVGLVEEVDSNTCKITLIDEYGMEDGYSYISLDSISQIVYASQDEARILKLWNTNYH